MEQLQNKIFELKNILLESEEYKNVKQCEEDLLEDEISLIIDFNNKIDAYNDAIKHGYFNDNYTKELSVAKEKLYSSKGATKYFEALKKMNDLLHEISELIFDDLVPDLKIK